MEHLQGTAEGDDTFDITNGHLHSLADIRIPPHVKVRHWNDSYFLSLIYMP